MMLLTNSFFSDISSALQEKGTKSISENLLNAIERRQRTSECSNSRQAADSIAWHKKKTIGYRQIWRDLVYSSVKIDLVHVSCK